MAIDLDAIKEHVDLIVGAETQADLDEVAASIREYVKDEHSLRFLRECWKVKRAKLC